MGVYIPNMSKPKGCWECFNADCNHWGENGYDNSGDCPLIDIVQCKDCKYWTDDMSGNMWCEHAIGGLTKANDFCSYGERRTDETQP